MDPVLDKYIALYVAARGIDCQRPTNDVLKDVIVEALTRPVTDRDQYFVTLHVQGTDENHGITVGFARLEDEEGLASLMLHALNALEPMWQNRHVVTATALAVAKPTLTVIYDVASGRMRNAAGDLVGWALPLRPTTEDSVGYADWTKRSTGQAADGSHAVR